MNTYRIICIIPFLLVTFVHAASFDCKKASTMVEHTICSDTELSNLDSQLGYLYRKVKDSIHSPYYSNQFIKESRRWFKERNRCRNKDCIRQKYHNRIIQLQTMLPRNTRNDANRYICYDDMITLLESNFYQGCVRSNIPCNDLGKHPFGKYSNHTMAIEALRQCKGNNAPFYDDPPQSNPAKQTIQIPEVTWGACMTICEDSSFCKNADHSKQTSVCTLNIAADHPDYKRLQKGCSQSLSNHWVVSYRNERWHIECSR